MKPLTAQICQNSGREEDHDDGGPHGAKASGKTETANPLGYLPAGGGVETIHIALPARQYLGFGPGWLRGWMFSLFLTFLLSSVVFKFLLKID